jgi:hypothetical protein
MASKKRTYRSAAERVQITEDGPLNGKTTPDIAGRFIQESLFAQLLKRSKTGKSRKSYLKTGVSYLKSCEKKKCCSRHNFIVILLQEINEKSVEQIRCNWLGLKTVPTPKAGQLKEY